MPRWPQCPHLQAALHSAGPLACLITPAPEVIAPHRTRDGAAGVLRHHGPTNRGAAGRVALDPQGRAIGHAARIDGQRALRCQRARLVELAAQPSYQSQE